MARSGAIAALAALVMALTAVGACSDDGEAGADDDPPTVTV